MKKLLVLAAIAATAGGAQAVVLFNNGPVVSGTPAISVIRPGGTTFGAGAQGALVPNPNVVADNFTVGGAGWQVQDLSFFSYQTGANSAFTFTGVNWSIVSGNVTTGSVVASGTTVPTNGGLQGYRVSATAQGDTTRAIFRLNADIPDVTLNAGSYWLRWSFTGSLASGPWQPPTSDGVVGNAQQSTAGGAFIALAEGVLPAGTAGVELPFIINGTIIPIPEPSTYALMLAGAAGVLVAARRRQAD